MARLARCEIFDPREVAVLHVMNRVCRRCFILGNDPVSGKSFNHRKGWIEDELKRLAATMGIDLLAFTCLSNHFNPSCARVAKSSKHGAMKKSLEVGAASAPQKVL